MRLVSLGESPLLMPSTHKRSQYQFIDQFYYYAVQLFIRLSFLVFFHRTLYTPRLSTSIRIVALVVLLQTIGTWIFYALQCRPLSAFFHPHGNPNAACISSRITYTAPNAVNAAINLLIYILPIPTLVGKAPQEIIRTTAASPQPPRPSSNAVSSPEPPKSPEPETLSSRSTAATIALFTMGGLGVTASFLRIAVLHHWSTAASTDYPYALALVAIVTTVELCLYITCSNLPSLRRSSATSTDGGGNERHELRSRRRRRRNRRGGGGGGHESEDELWGVSEGKGITITSRVSISITEALRGAQGAQRDGVPYYPKKYFKFARPGTRSPTPNLLKELEG
ncbi:hypothetical protein MPH_03643 [Macrophomina phaseolina MS6]|uniref:Rhodopsin domain-containing protein n=1 Tax=Macrophomina phaseolina (strain MS6) TaxID=1126212 RepID=K2S287_MACPH|nr:hypothetical protein MPH_03643 [Macrophomina phaseolina MS6]